MATTRHYLAVLDETEYQVDVDILDDGRYRVVIDGSAELVDARFLDAETMTLLLDGASYDAGVSLSDGTARVYQQGRDRLVEVLDERRLRQRQLGPREREGSAGVITAPMPGKVVRLLVAEGDQVTARQPVVVVEAMKMENELFAPRDGVITQVAVCEGDNVEAGAVLVAVG